MVIKQVIEPCGDLNTWVYYLVYLNDGGKYPQFTIKLLSPVANYFLDTIENRNLDWRMFTCNDVQVDTKRFKNGPQEHVTIGSILKIIEKGSFNINDVFNDARRWRLISHDTDNGTVHYWRRSEWEDTVERTSEDGSERIFKGNVEKTIELVKRLIGNFGKDLSSHCFELEEATYHKKGVVSLDYFNVYYDDAVPLK